MANTVLLRKPLNIAQDAIQDYFDLFYEMNSIEINNKFVTASLELSDTPITNTKTIRLVYAQEAIATAQIEAYIVLGYTLIKTQSTGNMIFAVLTINGTVKVFKCLISQSGILAPTFNVLKNTTNKNGINSYNAMGSYFSDFDIDYDPTKIYIHQNQVMVYDPNGFGISYMLQDNNGKVRFLITSHDSTVPADGMMANEEFCFEVYP